MDEAQDDKFRDKIAGLLVHYNRYLSYMWSVELDEPDDDLAIGFLNDENNKVDEFIVDILKVLDKSGAE